LNLERETRLELATPTLARLMARPAPRKATEILAGGVPWRKVPREPLSQFWGSNER
jgi:hypothetical protein